MIQCWAGPKDSHPSVDPAFNLEPLPHLLEPFPHLSAIQVLASLNVPDDEAWLVRDGKRIVIKVNGGRNER